MQAKEEEKAIIVINKKEIMNIGYMFRNDCFDMAININDRDIILSPSKMAYFALVLPISIVSIKLIVFFANILIMRLK